MRGLTILLAGPLPLAAEAHEPITVGYPMLLSGSGTPYGAPALEGTHLHSGGTDS